MPIAETLPSLKKLIFNKKSTLLVLLSFCILLGLSAYLELLGWRILNPEFSLSQIWNRAFIFETFRTAFGAALLGFVLVMIGLIPGRKRAWPFSHYLLLWCFGAGLFLSAMTALILWAP